MPSPVITSDIVVLALQKKDPGDVYAITTAGESHDNILFNFGS